MEWVETTGRTIEQAKEAALEQLGVADADAEFVIVSEPKAGLFGRMRGEARVRARVRPTQPRPKRTRTRRQGQTSGRRGGGDGRRGGGRDRSEPVAPAVSGVAVADTDRDVDDGGSGPTSETTSTSGSGTGSGAARRRRRRGGRGRGGASAGGAGGADRNGARSMADGPVSSGASENGAASETRAEQSQRKSDRQPAATKEDSVGDTLSLEEQGESAREFVEGLVRELGLDAAVSSRVVDEETAEVAVDGESLGLLVGPGGATLQALQEITRTYVQRRTGGHSDRIMVDVAGYRARRAEALQRFTRQIVEEVLASRQERALEPMAASDRKVVHDTVNAIEGVATRSEGEDPRRYIVISPVGEPGDVDE